MFLKNIILVFCLFLPAQLIAQIDNKLFIGVASLDSGITISYKFQFSTADNKISGYTIADVNGHNETKSSITGTIDDAQKHIKFKESGIIYTKSMSDKAEFCFIQGNLKRLKFKGTVALKGDIVGFKADGVTPCANGKLILIDATNAMQLLLNHNMFDSLETNDKNNTKVLATKKEGSKMEIISNDTFVNNTKAINESKKEQIITTETIPKEILKIAPGKAIEISCPVANYAFEVWDDKNVDGDIIDVYEGVKPILKNYKLTENRIHLNLNMLDKTVDTLKIVAISEGTDPLNTARVKITSGSEVYYIDATSSIGKDVFIILRKR